MRELLHNCLNGESFLTVLLKNKLCYHILALLAFASCTGMNGERNEVNIKVHAYMDREVPVLLMVNYAMLSKHASPGLCQTLFDKLTPALRPAPAVATSPRLRLCWKKFWIP